MEGAENSHVETAEIQWLEMELVEEKWEVKARGTMSRIRSLDGLEDKEERRAGEVSDTRRLCRGGTVTGCGNWRPFGTR